MIGPWVAVWLALGLTGAVLRFAKETSSRAALQSATAIGPMTKCEPAR